MGGLDGIIVKVIGGLKQPIERIRTVKCREMDFRWTGVVIERRWRWRRRWWLVGVLSGHDVDQICNICGEGVKSGIGGSGKMEKSLNVVWWISSWLVIWFRRYVSCSIFPGRHGGEIENESTKLIGPLSGLTSKKIEIRRNTGLEQFSLLSFSH